MESDGVDDKVSGPSSGGIQLWWVRTVNEPEKANDLPAGRSWARAALGPAYFVGVAAAAGILTWEHQLVGPDDLSQLVHQYLQKEPTERPETIRTVQQELQRIAELA